MWLAVKIEKGRRLTKGERISDRYKQEKLKQSKGKSSPPTPTKGDEILGGEGEEGGGSSRARVRVREGQQRDFQNWYFSSMFQNNQISKFGNKRFGIRRVVKGGKHK